MKFIETFESLPKWAKIVFILCVPIFGANYRMLKYAESKNKDTLHWGVLSVVPFVGQIVGIIDALSEYKNNKITFHID